MMSNDARRQTVRSVFDRHIEAMEAARGLESEILEAAASTIDTIRGGGRVLLVGNGGSASDADHLAGEFVGRFYRNRDPWPALALHSGAAALTAMANDFGYVEAFRRLALAHARPGDILWAISTSGNSENVLVAAEAVRGLPVRVVGFTGRDGGRLKPLCDLCLCAPSDDTPRVQEVHMLIGHAICQLVEEALS
ncbi:MAG: SIS domain-containing protein [Fimbriimonadaceae bacterium]